MKSSTFYFSTISFLAGTLVFSFLTIDVRILESSAAAAAAGAAAFLLFRRQTIALIICGSLCFTLGAWRIESAKAGEHALDASIGKRVDLSGFICDEPTDKGATTGLCFQPYDSPDRMILTVGNSPKRAYGEGIRVRGIMKLPANFLTYEGGPEFDYVSYLAKDGIRYTMYRPSVADTGRYDGSLIVAALIKLKGYFTDTMRRLVPEPQASLLGGLLLGDKQSLPKSIANDFKRAGLVHILVLSGYNVTVVAESLVKAFSFLPRAIAMSSGVVSIVLFAIMTGASSTTVRASVMAIIAIGARASARRYDVTRALIAAAVAMTTMNPRTLAFDVSFQLSFMATLALLFVSPLVSERLTFITERWKLREMIATTISTQIFVLPLLLYVMGQTSLVAFISNPFVLPAVPYSMLGGFVATTVGLLSIRLALPISFATNALLVYIIKATSFFAAFPFAVIQTAASAWALAAAYAVYAAILIFLWRRRLSKNSPRTSAN